MTIKGDSIPRTTPIVKFDWKKEWGISETGIFWGKNAFARTTKNSRVF